MAYLVSDCDIIECEVRDFINVGGAVGEVSKSWLVPLDVDILTNVQY